MVIFLFKAVWFSGFVKELNTCSCRLKAGLLFSYKESMFCFIHRAQLYNLKTFGNL